MPSYRRWRIVDNLLSKLQIPVQSSRFTALLHRYLVLTLTLSHAASTGRYRPFPILPSMAHCGLLQKISLPSSFHCAVTGRRRESRLAARASAPAVTGSAWQVYCTLSCRSLRRRRILLIRLDFTATLSHAASIRLRFTAPGQADRIKPLLRG